MGWIWSGSLRRKGADEFAEPTVLYLGRLKRYKGVDLVLRAVAGLRDQDPSSDSSWPAKEITWRNSRISRQDLLGPGHRGVSGVCGKRRRSGLLQRSWIHVLTSPKEGWGISIMEAAACGTPTVASDSPGLRDAVIG